MACTAKDEDTGQMVTRTKSVKGPAALFLTSTSRSSDDELLNRLLVLTIDEKGVVALGAIMSLKWWQEEQKALPSTDTVRRLSLSQSTFCKHALAWGKFI